MIHIQGIAVLVVINFCVYFMCLIRQCQQPLFKHSVCKASHWTETFINTDSELVSINDLYNYTYCMFTVIMLDNCFSEKLHFSHLVVWSHYC